GAVRPGPVRPGGGGRVGDVPALPPPRTTAAGPVHARPRRRCRGRLRSVAARPVSAVKECARWLASPAPGPRVLLPASGVKPLGRKPGAGGEAAPADSLVRPDRRGL